MYELEGYCPNCGDLVKFKYDKNNVPRCVKCGKEVEPIEGVKNESYNKNNNVIETNENHSLVLVDSKTHAGTELREVPITTKSLFSLICNGSVHITVVDYDTGEVRYKSIWNNELTDLIIKRIEIKNYEIVISI